MTESLKKSAIITGITGQTGSYLAERLLQHGYKVYGLIRRTSNFNTSRIDHIFSDLELVYGDLSDSASIEKLVRTVQPDLFFNMGAQSHVRVSFDTPVDTFNLTGTSVIRVLEALRQFSPKTHLVQASSSEQFGSSPPPQNEETKMHPRSPYAVAKLAGYWNVIHYREAYNMFASNLIMFNTESKRRGETFVTRKITRAATRIYTGLQDKLSLGNLEAKRDFTHASDSANAAFLVATHEKADDFVVGSSQSISIRDFAYEVFNRLGMNYLDYIQFDEKYVRPTEVDHLECDPSKIKKVLGWAPKYDLGMLIDEMIENDLALAKQEKMIKEMSK